MTKRIYNFAAGPCTLPLSALEIAQGEFVNFDDGGMSIIEMSHRSKGYDKVHTAAMANLRELLSIPNTHDIAFIQGGATLQFSMIPMNFLKKGKKAAFAFTGSWSKKALLDAQKVGDTRIAWTGEDENFVRMPDAADLTVTEEDAYLHMCTNETIGGIEFQGNFPDTGDVPIIADMSSHIMSRAIDFSKVDLVFGGAQKNLGPAGVGFAIINKKLVENANEGLPSYLRYGTHTSKDSLYNTPPVFAIYMLKLTLDWVKKQGGLSAMENNAIKRSSLVYDAMNQSDGWYKCPMDPATRSRMNVVFRLPSEDLEKKFIAEALAADMSGLKGHRSVGGCRASMYNAMPLEGAEKLAEFMTSFKKDNA